MSKFTYVVQMLDGRELRLDGDLSMAAALITAGEHLVDVKSWYLIPANLSSQLTEEEVG